MKIYIENGKINYNSKGDVIEVNDNFFDDYKYQVDTYIFEIKNGVLVCKNKGEIDKKNELKGIEEILKKALPRYNELKELGEMRSTEEEQEYQVMETKKTELLTQRQQLLQ